jgi:tetratricopeptide (TPR) repeat protein
MFAHELIRQTLLSGLSILRRQRLHMSVANALERLDPTAKDTRPSEIAHHLLQAGAAAESSRTLDYLMRAANRAFDSAAFEESLKAVDDALTIVEPDETAIRAELLERKGWTVRALGRFEECMAIWDEVLDLYAGLGQTERVARLVYELGYMLVWLNRFEDAFAYHARGRAMVGDERSPAAALLLGGGGALVGFAGFYDLAIETLDEGEQIAMEVQDDRALGFVNWARCVTMLSHGRPHDAATFGRESLEPLRRSDLWTLVDALGWFSMALTYTGNPDEALLHAEEGISLGIKVGHKSGEIFAARSLAMAKLMLGASPEESSERWQSDLERMTEIGSPFVSQSHAWLSVAHTMRGDLDAGLEHAEAATTLDPATSWAGAGWGTKLINRAAAGDEAACRTMLDERLEQVLTNSGEMPTGQLLSITVLTEVSSQFGWTDELERLYPMVETFPARCPIHMITMGMMDRIVGTAAAALDKWDEAEQHFEKAISDAGAWPNSFDEPEVKHRYAEMLLRRGRPEDADRARRFLESAIEKYRERGMPIVLAQAEALLART